MWGSCNRPERDPHPSDAGDEERAFAAPRLSPPPEGAPQRRHDLREASDALKWIVRAGAPWRAPPHGLPPW